MSTEDQANEGFSLDAQTRRLTAYCNVRGWEIADIYRDEGFSGRSTKRPEYQRMLSESDRWDVILVLKMDRIHRNSVNFTQMMDFLREKGKEFNSMQEKFDSTTAMGRFVMDIMQRIAQLESEQIGERVKIGMVRKAEKGEYMGTAKPYGYVYSKGSLSVVENEASVVKDIYMLFDKGYSAQDIANVLNNSHIPAKRSGQWSRQSVWNILHNPLYAGYHRWSGKLYKGNHSPIIDLSEFERINGPLKV